MPSAITLSGPPDGLSGPPDVPQRGCRCVRNPRTGKSVQLCPVPKTSKHRSGWKFTGPCRRG